MVSHFFLLFLFLLDWTRLRKLVSLLFKNLDFGVQFGRLLVVTRLSWVCFCSLQLHSWPGFLLFLNFRPVCSLTKHSAEVYRFLVFLGDNRRIVHHATRSDLTESKIFVCANFSIIPMQFIFVISCCNYGSYRAALVQFCVFYLTEAL